MYICIEGNIGAGKSTVLSILRNLGVITREEPIDVWRGVDENLLEKLYEDPKKYSFAFQKLAIETTKIIDGNEPMITERSVYSTFHVFTELAREKLYLNEQQYTELHELYKHTISTQVPIEAIIYIRTPAKTCFERVKIRKRKEEEGKLDLKVLEQLEALHDKVFIGNQHLFKFPIYVLDGQQSSEYLTIRILNIMYKHRVYTISAR